MKYRHQLEDVSVGPIELVAVRFPGNRFTGEIIDALGEILDRGTLRIVDAVFASRSEHGEVRVLNLAELHPHSLAALAPLVEDVLGVLSEEDAANMGAVLPNGASAGLLLLENVGRSLAIAECEALAM